MWGVSEGWTQIVNCMLKQKSFPANVLFWKPRIHQCDYTALGRARRLDRRRNFLSCENLVKKDYKCEKLFQRTSLTKNIVQEKLYWSLIICLKNIQFGNVVHVVRFSNQSSLDQVDCILRVACAWMSSFQSKKLSARCIYVFFGGMFFLIFRGKDAI